MTVTQRTALSKICAGSLAVAEPGARLPSVRELTARHQASPVTVAEAVRQLVAEGLIEARPGRGTFVAARAATSRRAPDLSWQTVALGAAPARRGRDAGATGVTARRARSRCPAATSTPTCSPPPRSAPRSPAPPGSPRPGSAARSRGARTCAPGSPARPGPGCAPTTW